MRTYLLLAMIFGFTTLAGLPAMAEEPMTDSAPAETAVTETTEAAADTAPAEVTEPQTSTEPSSATQPEGENPVVIIKTGKGDIKVKLFSDKAPLSVANFLAYVDSGHYEGTIFHRVIGNFMIQGGGFTPDMQQKPTLAPIKNEAQNGLSNKRGTLAMARTQVIDSATSQFFINLVDNNFLNFRSPDAQGFGYCVFGEVVEGMDVVDQIKAVRTTRNGPHSDVPAEPIEIIQVVRVNTGK